MKKLLEYLVSLIVSHPQEIIVTEEETDQLVTLSLTVHPDDIKIVIGKNGRTVKALRELLHLKAIKTGKRINLKIINPT